MTDVMIYPLEIETSVNICNSIDWPGAIGVDVRNPVTSSSCSVRC